MAHLDDGSYWGDQFERLGHPSGKLDIRSVKLFTDGKHLDLQLTHHKIWGSYSYLIA